MDHQHFAMWTSRFLLVSVRQCDVQSASSVPLLICFPTQFPPVTYLFNYCVIASLTSQGSWLWLWARWVVGNHLFCSQRWERCRGYQEQSPGTGQFKFPVFCLCWSTLILRLKRHYQRLHLNDWVVVLYCRRLFSSTITKLRKQGCLWK